MNNTLLEINHLWENNDFDGDKREKEEDGSSGSEQHHNSGLHMAPKSIGHSSHHDGNGNTYSARNYS